MKKILKKTEGSKGAISVIVALSVLAIILTIGLSASSVISGELALSGDASESAKAYFSAETGLEEAIYNYRNSIVPGAARWCSNGWVNIASSDIKYCLVLDPVNPSTAGDISSIKSIGEYGSVRRSVEISF